MKMHTAYENMMHLEHLGCNLRMGNQEKAEKGDTVMATSTRLFQGRVVLSASLGRTPTIKENKTAVQGIPLTTFTPPVEAMTA